MLLSPFNISPWAFCPKCDASLQVNASSVIAYLNQEKTVCIACGEKLDWWMVVLQGIEKNFMGNQSLSFIEARTTCFTLLLRPGQRTIYRFSDHGIPIGSKIFYINYSPNGSGANTLFPLEVHGNVSTLKFRTDEVVLYPMPITDEGNAEQTAVSVMVTWIPNERVDESWQSLFDAFEAFIAGQYSAVIVPANVAVESCLLRLMTTYVDQLLGKKSNATTYSHQLNVLLPIIAKLNNLPLLPSHIVGSLNRLRGLRNDLAHKGVTGLPLAKNDASEVLCAALFGLHYARHLQNLLCPSE